MVKSFGQNFGDAPEIVKFEKARELLDSLSCLRLLGSGFKVQGSKKAQRKKLKADRPEQILRRLESREASRPEGGKVQPNAIPKTRKDESTKKYLTPAPLGSLEAQRTQRSCRSRSQQGPTKAPTSKLAAPFGCPR